MDSENHDPSPREIGQMIRGEVNNFFDRAENVMRVANDHQVAVLQLLPENERTKFLLESQTATIAFFENIVDKLFEVGSKMVDKAVS